MLPTGFLILPMFDSHQKCNSPGQREMTELILTRLLFFTGIIVCRGQYGLLPCPLVLLEC